MPSRIIYRSILRLKEPEIQEMQRILDMDGETFRLTGIASSKILRLYDIDFEDGYRLKLWIYAGTLIGEKYRPGYVLCHLINRNDNKEGEDIISSQIEGQYKFSNKDKIYLLDIIAD